MSQSAIRDLFAQIELETGASINLTNPSGNVSELPRSLRSLYAVTDGVALPFGDIYPMDSFHTEGFPPDWLCFGADHYFSYYLCHTSSRPSITSWDHESHTEIEPVFDSAYEWLAGAYCDFIESDLRFCRVRVIAIPSSTPKAALLSHLKSLATKTSSEWLNLLRGGSFDIPDVKRLEAIKTVRALQARGVDCYVDCGPP